MDLEALLRKADRMMYLQKSQHRSAASEAERGLP